jgi:hypothetical protein
MTGMPVSFNALGVTFDPDRLTTVEEQPPGRDFSLRQMLYGSDARSRIRRPLRPPKSTEQNIIY